MWITVLQFILCSGLIFFAGTRLTRYGDAIAELTGLGRTWVGVVLIATVTSLPELITALSSVSVYNLPDIAAGNVLGACMVNLAMISVLDLVGGATPVSAKVHEGHVLSAGFGILMLGLLSLSLAIGDSLPSIGWLGPYSLLLVATYLVAMKTVFAYERRRIAEFMRELGEEEPSRAMSLKRACVYFGLNALVIVAAALYLPLVAERIAEQTGLGQTFVGSLFVALATTLPEITVSLSAFRLGALDMAVGNLFGSNLFNVTILALGDFFFVKGPLLSHVLAANHLLSALGAISMTAVAVIGLTYRAARKPLLFSWDAIAILAIYATTLALLYARA